MRTKWTTHKIRLEASKYNTRNLFKRGSRNAYEAAKRHNILDIVCAHMDAAYKNWSYDLIMTEAIKYHTKSDFVRGSSKAYGAARHKGILDEVCSHMKSKFTFWSEEDIRDEALKFKTRSEFSKKSRSAYEAARNRNILDDVCSHMKSKVITVKKLESIAIKYQSRKEFEIGDGSAYQTARKRGILDEICSHMDRQRNIWTEDMIWEEVSKYSVYNDFVTQSIAAYTAASRRGMLEDIAEVIEFKHHKENRSIEEKKLMRHIRGSLTRIITTLTGNNKTRVIGRIDPEKAIGCSINDLKAHLETKFEQGMNWSNYGRSKGRRTWEIDHVIPLSVAIDHGFSAEEINHYTNLQPMWTDENIRKSNNI